MRHVHRPDDWVVNRSFMDDLFFDYSLMGNFKGSVEEFTGGYLCMNVSPGLQLEKAIWIGGIRFCASSANCVRLR